MMSNEQNYVAVETERKFLEDKLNQLIKNIGDIPIANKRIMPYGWRKGHPIHVWLHPSNEAATEDATGSVFSCSIRSQLRRPLTPKLA